MKTISWFLSVFERDVCLFTYGKPSFKNVNTKLEECSQTWLIVWCNLRIPHVKLLIVKPGKWKICKDTKFRCVLDRFVFSQTSTIRLERDVSEMFFFCFFLALSPSSRIVVYVVCLAGISTCGLMLNGVRHACWWYDRRCTPSASMAWCMHGMKCNDPQTTDFYYLTTWRPVLHGSRFFSPSSRTTMDNHSYDQ